MLSVCDRAKALTAGLYALGGALFLSCAAYSFRRHIHVDELTALYSIQLGAAFGHGDFASIELGSVLLRPLARALGSSQHLFVGFRWYELALLFGLCLSVSQVQRALPSALGRAAAFIGAVSFGPLWRHGFELRHDMYVALGIVLLAWAAERARSGRASWRVSGITGFGVVLVQANSSKAFVIWLPALVLCALLGARGQRPWFKRAGMELLYFLPGLLLGTLFVAAVLGQAGMLTAYLAQLRQFTNFAAAPPYRLAALPLLTFAIERAPVHALFVALGLLTVAARTIARRDLGAAWVPFGAFCISALAICLNPTPFPYNLTWLSTAWLLMAAVGAAQCFSLAQRVLHRSGAWALATLSGAAALASFYSCEQDPYYRKDWTSQLRVIAGAEALTRPDEPVLDLCGLVVSRPPVAKDWIVHSLLMPAYHAGERETVRHIIERVWPPVAVTVYRWGFLDPADWAAFRGNYVRFSADLWTLGSTLSPSSTHFNVRRTGRYQVRDANDAGLLDGQPIHGGDVLWLTRGAHTIQSSTRYVLAWTGPGSPPAPPPPSNPLFENGELRGQRDK